MGSSMSFAKVSENPISYAGRDGAIKLLIHGDDPDHHNPRRDLAGNLPAVLIPDHPILPALPSTLCALSPSARHLRTYLVAPRPHRRHNNAPRPPVCLATGRNGR